MRLGKVFGIVIILNPFFLALMVLYALAGIFLQGILVFTVVLVHELAHIISAKVLGLQVTEIELLPFGGVARLEDFLEMKPDHEWRVALAGPASNLVLILLTALVYWFGDFQHPLLIFFCKVNLMLMLFNLLPVLPLDGGRIYRALMMSKLGFKESTQRAAENGKGYCVILICLGTMGFYMGLTGLDFLITVGFLVYASVRERGKTMYLFMRYMTRKKEELVNCGVMPVEQVVVAGNVSLRSITKYMIPKKFCMITVLDGDLRIMGTITETEIIEGILSLGLEYPVSNLLPR